MVNSCIQHLFSPPPLFLSLNSYFSYFFCFTSSCIILFAGAAADWKRAERVPPHPTDLSPPHSPPRFLLFSGATKEEEEQSEKAKALKLIRIFSPFFLCACFTYTFLIRVFCLPVSAIAEAQKNSEGIGSASFVALVVVRSRASQTFLLSPPHRNK